MANNDNGIGWCPDDCQRDVINASKGWHLVLAPPGCGKTQILAERISKAHAQGMGFADMLCLTFTNRAARGMWQRIHSNINSKEIDELYVGNVHRFCSRFLFANNVIPAESSVIDEDDAVSILARYFDEDEYAVNASYKRRKEYSKVFQLAALMHQIRQGHPRELRMHPECIGSDDVSAIRRICEIQKMTFDAKAIIDIYDNADFYWDAVQSEAYDYGTRTIASVFLRKLTMAKAYDKYKRKNRLLDFADLLMFAYDELISDKTGHYKRYSWVQVDEVQDINAMQMAIIDAVTAKEFHTVMYLGDEQQAIFSFMGAKMGMLDLLKERCKGCVHHLSVNHRSPNYLLDVFNTYAKDVLGIDSGLLPQTSYAPNRLGNELRIMGCVTYEAEVKDVAEITRRLLETDDSETTAIVVSANRDAEDISAELSRVGIGHFKVSGKDLFSSEEIKFTIAHLNLLNNDLNFLAWSRIIKGMKIMAHNADARKLVRDMLDRAMVPTDFIDYPDGRTYVQDFAGIYGSHDIVVFDTETTGLSVFDDDIVQIAALRLRKGKIVEGSQFTVFMSTDKVIPEKLGELDNPLIDEMKRHELMEHSEGLNMFLDYVGDSVLLGHNVEYDYRILENNLRRYCGGLELSTKCSKYFDSLRLIRLLEPELKVFKLKYLLSVLGLEGSNTHLADDDVFATCSLVKYCYEKACQVVAEQKRFMERLTVVECARALRQNYSYLFKEARKRLYYRCGRGFWENRPEAYGGIMIDQPALSAEFSIFYNTAVDRGYIGLIDGMQYVHDFLSCDVLSNEYELSLAEQLARHIMDINTYKEADLCGSRSLKERIYVTTVHKAKGLEFDNVIVFDAIDGRYPNFYSKNNPAQMAEDARKFYVAMTRAKKRLYVAYSMTRVDYHNRVHELNVTPFMNPINTLFD